MTRDEARERAHKIWGDQVTGIAASFPLGKHPPGEVEWWVDLKNGRSHSLDCNGHAVCHQECGEAEVQVT